MVQLHKREDQNLDFQNQCKSQTGLADACNLSTWVPPKNLLARLDGFREPWGQSHQISDPAS